MDHRSTLFIYEASAGAGKTFALVSRYLSGILSQPGGYRSVLAVTFTNKATAEIKERILRILQGLSLLEKNPSDEHELARQARAYLPGLEQEMNLSTGEICKKATQTLRDILFDYSFFSVQTIDSFFQRVMREFARETGLPFGYTIEIDNQQAVTESVDRMLDETKPGEPLFRFLVDLVNRFSDEGKWDIRTKLIREGSQLFSEHFKVPENEKPLELLTGIEKELFTLIRNYENKVKEFGETGMELLSRYEYHPEDFTYKKNGVPAMFPVMLEGKLQPKQRFINALDDPETMLTAQDKTERRKKEFVNLHLHPLLLRIGAFYTKHFQVYTSAKMLVSMLHGYGVQVMLREYIHRWIRDENRFLIAEVNRFLKGIIGDNELPFIYEKIGQHFQSYLLDEFQDTSHFQYHNLRPLMKDSLSRGYYSMVVGDIKQSIYRWRNSDWAIMAKEVPEDFGNDKVETITLDTNYRSRENVVRFNNLFFSIAPEVLAELLLDKIDRVRKEYPMIVSGEISEMTDLIRKAYSDKKLKQKIPDKQERSGGYVCVRFLNKEDHPDWREEASRLVCEKIGALITDGYEPGQITLLVRKNDEGARIIRALLSWQKEQPGRQKFPVISDDALSLEQSVAVRLIMELMQCIVKPEDLLAFATFYYTVQRPGIPLKTEGRRLSDTLAETMSGRERWHFFLPGIDDTLLDALVRLPLSEVIRTVIRTFKLDTLPEEVPFLYALENKALDHISQGGTGISSFLEWWEENGKTQKVPLPDSLNAVRVMTIYKAKGLGMEIVILPFADWAFEIAGGNQTRTLWCESNHPPFDRLKQVPVVYRNGMLVSLFGREYLDEAVSQYIENLNLIYVSFTRAVSQLYAFTGTESGSGRTGKLLVETITRLVEHPTENNTLVNKLLRFEDHIKLEYGTYNQASRNGLQSVPEVISYFPVTQAFNRFRFLPQGRKYFLLKKAGRERKIDVGNLFHSLLSEVYVRSDIEPAVRKAVRSGMIPAGDKDGYIARLYEITGSEQAADWFSGKWQVLNEMPVILPGSVFLRPDRVMIKGHEALVVDYKFGEQEESGYRRQVKRYMESISRLGYAPVTGVIWYVNLGKQELISPEH